jgi:YidC/Oxa1 family membrane protein insertase
MEKRLVIAIGLSLLVLLTWSVLIPKSQPVVMQRVNKLSADASAPLSVNNIDLPQVIAREDKPLVYEQENLKAIFNESQATLQKVIFTHYNDDELSLKYGFLLGDTSLVFKKGEVTDNSVSFYATTPTHKIIKRFIFHKFNYTIILEIIIKNNSTTSLSMAIPISLGILDFSHNNPQVRYQDLTVGLQEKVFHVNGRKDAQFLDIKFFGLRDQYFAAIIEPNFEQANAFIKKLNNQESEVGINVQTINIPPNQQIGHLYKIYLGPQDLTIINKVNPLWGNIIHFGKFDFISQVLLQILNFLYKILHNWGLAIIFLSLLVYMTLYPLSLKQMRSMKEMQTLQPKIEILRQTYKDNPQKLNKEIMDLYKEHNVNPLGGCLPLLLQMPIFFALYNALIRSIALKGARFLWIQDLSKPDNLWTFPHSWPKLPIIGNELNILPIVMAIGMFFQQKISSTSSTSIATEQQRVMLIIMPIMFCLIFYRMPSGLVLYWFVNSTLMLFFQLRLNKAKA